MLLSHQTDSVLALSNKIASGKPRAVETSTTASTLLSLALTLTLALLTLILTLTSLALATLTVVAGIVAAVLTVVLTTTSGTILSDLKPDTVVLGVPLSNRHDYRLMIGSRCDGANPILTSRETSRKIGREGSLPITSIIDSLKECKSLGIGRVCGVLLVVQVLDRDVSVTNTLATLETLRGSVVGIIRVGKCPSF